MQAQTIAPDEKPPVKPRTALAREASRKNGCKSNGPKTPEGKARKTNPALAEKVEAALAPNQPGQAVPNRRRVL